MKYNAPALEMGIKLIQELSCSNAPMNLTDIATFLGTNKNTATRLLMTLKRAGWVDTEKPGPRYKLTLKPFSILSKTADRVNLKQEAILPLRKLWEDSGETVYLDVLLNDEALRLEQFDATGPIKVSGKIGALYYLHCSAPGKVLLAYGGEELFTRIVEKGLKSQTKNTITTKKALRLELEKIRKQGYAQDNEEYGKGLICFAAPVFDMSGKVVGAIGASATTISYDLDKFTKQIGGKITATAEIVSQRLGFKK